MGKITNIQNKYNKVQKEKLQKHDDIQLKKQMDEIIKAKSKQKLRINSFKDIATLLGPSACKYKLSKNQRSFQIKGRLTIAAIASALSIGGTTSIAHRIASNVTSKQEIEQSNEYLETNLILKEANTRIRHYVYGNDKEKIANSFISYDYDSSDNSTSFKIGRNKYEFDEKIDFSYSNSSIIANIKNNSDINKLIEQMIEIHYSETPTIEQLKRLQDILDKLENRNFKLQGKNIVEDKNYENER